MQLILAALIAALPDILAQKLPPSLKESVGCEPHDDNWHCEGQAVPSTTVIRLLKLMVGLRGPVHRLSSWVLLDWQCSSFSYLACVEYRYR
ncbi:hypothetical protein BCR34DRAFT_580627 [Clohesyomyces aquaticus]|uniref:Uncharacterized protein n=1 Tax=Clohesyomyces aquaticus TaxID=1231657 RepID=A0A1Y1Y5L4_9PLEO|nr:hypothetical protein BCR34DRAFT_580627 [Clohesyomyces aquaticus]